MLVSSQNMNQFDEPGSLDGDRCFSLLAIFFLKRTLDHCLTIPTNLSRFPFHNWSRNENPLKNDQVTTIPVKSVLEEDHFEKYSISINLHSFARRCIRAHFKIRMSAWPIRNPFRIHQICCLIDGRLCQTSIASVQQSGESLADLRMQNRRNR